MPPRDGRITTYGVGGNGWSPQGLVEGLASATQKGDAWVHSSACRAILAAEFMAEAAVPYSMITPGSTIR